MRFSDRVVLITGAGSGIGRVMARRFADEGAAVLVADWKAGLAEEAAGEVETGGGRALGVEADVSSAADVDRLVGAAERELGRPVDVLVNNAAIADGDNVLAMDEQTWDKDVDVVLKSAFLCSKRVLPGMVERRAGAIVNIASVNALAYFGNEAYSAAKAGMISLTRSIAVRFGKYGVRANAIAPGTIRTPIWQERIDKEPDVLERVARWYPLGRVGEPEDIASAAVFLASDEAAWITGAVLPVDGGLLAGNDVMTAELLVEAREQDVPGAYRA